MSVKEQIIEIDQMLWSIRGTPSRVCSRLDCFSTTKWVKYLTEINYKESLWN